MDKSQRNNNRLGGVEASDRRRSASHYRDGGSAAGVRRGASCSALRRDRGASFVEYLILVAFVGLAAIAAFRAFRTAVSETMDAEARSVLSLSADGRHGAGAATVPGADGDRTGEPSATNESRSSGGRESKKDDSCSGFWSCAWDKVKEGPKQWWGYEKGVFGAAWDDVSGTVVDAKDFVVTLFTDPKQLVTGTVDTVKYVVQHPGDALKSLVWDDESSEAWKRGDYSQAIGRTAWNVGSFFIPGVGEIKGASKLGKLGRLAHDVEKKIPGGKHDGHAPQHTPPCEGNSCKGPNGPCFAAGTAVYTADGLRPIEEVRAGDRVWSRDETSGEVRVQRVARTFVTQHQRVLRLSVDYGDGALEELVVTPEHPFFTERGRLAAGELRVEDRVLLLSGAPVIVREVEPTTARVTVYNFEVESFHTYFVGSGGLWVHNDCTDPPNNGDGHPGETGPGADGSGNPGADGKPSSPKSSPSAAVKWKSFAKGKLAEHYEKHGHEFGNITQAEYLKRAMNFAKETGDRFQETQIGNIIVKYDPDTRRVLIGNAKTREIRSFYKAGDDVTDPFQEAIDTATKKTGKGDGSSDADGEGESGTADGKDDGNDDEPTAGN